jgi:hypothetical protein
VFATLEATADAVNEGIDDSQDLVSAAMDIALKHQFNLRGPVDSLMMEFPDSDGEMP